MEPGLQLMTSSIRFLPTAMCRQRASSKTCHQCPARQPSAPPWYRSSFRATGSMKLQTLEWSRSFQRTSGSQCVDPLWTEQFLVAPLRAAQTQQSIPWYKALWSVMAHGHVSRRQASQTRATLAAHARSPTTSQFASPIYHVSAVQQHNPETRSS